MLGVKPHHHQASYYTITIHVFYKLISVTSCAVNTS